MTRAMLINKQGLKIYFGTFSGWGSNRGIGSSYRRMMCLRDISNKSGDFIADHVWLEVPDSMSSTWLRKGYQVEFLAEPYSYSGGSSTKLGLRNARGFCRLDLNGRKDRLKDDTRD